MLIIQQKKIDTNTIIIIADQAISFLISIKENNKNTFNDAIELASISNRESTLSAMLSLFDSLWIRSDIEKQKTIKHAYLKYLKNSNLKMKIIDVKGLPNIRRVNNTYH